MAYSTKQEILLREPLEESRSSEKSQSVTTNWNQRFYILNYIQRALCDINVIILWYNCLLRFKK